MTYCSRPYQAHSDLERLRTFILNTRAKTVGNFGCIHVGDLVWRIFHNGQTNATEDICLWEDEAEMIVGFAWFYPPDAVEIHMAPELRNQGVLESEMLDWAETRCHTCATPEKPVTKLITEAFHDDVERIAYLESLGFKSDEFHFLMMERSLLEPIPEHPLPAGFQIHSIEEEAMFAERVSIHQEVWHPSKVTLDTYTTMRQINGYDPKLDLVVEAPDGSYAAYCVCWMDEMNLCGEFEPVGTRAAYRQQGLGKAVLYEGLRRLKARGAETAIVYSVGSNQASVRLYESVGFKIIHRNHDYVKMLDSSS